MYETGSYQDCLDYLKRAQIVEYSDKVQRKIDRIEEQFKSMNLVNDENDRSNDIDDTVFLDAVFQIPKKLYENLYFYQRDGVRWLWQLHSTSVGGILADDMGLGKTVQV